MKQLLIFFIAFLFVGCSTMQPLQIADIQYKSYQPIEPLPVKNVEVYTGGKFVVKPWAALGDSTIRDLLPNQSAQIAMRTNDLTGKVNYLTASVTDKAGSYEVIMDFMKYRIEDVYDKYEVAGSGRIGIGLRVKAKVITYKANLNLSSLANLGVEASNNHLTGLLSIDIIGIDSKDITNYIPLTAKLDETSIQNALQAIATIKSKIWDANVKITPQLIAINQNKDSSEKLIKEKITSGTFSYTNTSGLISIYWKPDGAQIEKAHEDKIKDWILSNGLDVSITYLINTSEMELYRQKLIDDLKIGSNENGNN
jgi:hypothetical protein